MMRAPDAPIGWPSAQAPPFTLTISLERFNSCMNAIGTTANASFTSQRSTSPASHPSRASSLRAAGTGAVVKSPGACAWLACPMIRARTGKFSFSAVAWLARTSAAAPSDIDDELAAVTVPSSRKAGLRCGIFSGRAVPGCSSRATVCAPRRDVAVTGTTSPSNPPDEIAFCARASERSA